MTTPTKAEMPKAERQQPATPAKPPAVSRMVSKAPVAFTAKHAPGPPAVVRTSAYHDQPLKRAGLRHSKVTADARAMIASCRNSRSN